MKNEKVYSMPFGKVYPLLVNKAQRRNRTEDEVLSVICWLTGYDRSGVEAALAQNIPYGRFFEDAPALNPNRVYIKGTICGVRVEAIEEPLMREIRRLDKLVDELAKGKPLEKVLSIAAPAGR